MRLRSVAPWLALFIILILVVSVAAARAGDHHARRVIAMSPAATTATTTAGTRPASAPTSTSSTTAPTATTTTLPVVHRHRFVLPSGTTAGPVPGSFVITVKAGETLSGIAAWFTTHGYGAIYRANRAELGPNANLILPGETIVVYPRDRQMAVIPDHAP